MSAAVDIRDAFRIHRSAGGTAVALQGLSLEVEEGEIVVVLGPSGSGKTTLLRILGGFDSLSAGTVHVLGEDMGRLSPGALASERRTSAFWISTMPARSRPTSPVRTPFAWASSCSASHGRARTPLPRRCSSASGSETGSTPGPSTSPAASSSASLSAPRWRTGPGSFSPTSRPASWTPRAPRPSTR